MTYLNSALRNGMIISSDTCVELQNKIQQGCGDGCGWTGDRALILRAAPAHRGGGWAVVHYEPGQEPVVVIRSDELTHKIIEALRDARKNFEDRTAFLAAVEAAEAAVEAEAAKKQVEVTSSLAVRAAHYLRKDL